MGCSHEAADGLRQRTDGRERAPDVRKIHVRSDAAYLENVRLMVVDSSPDKSMLCSLSSSAPLCSNRSTLNISTRLMFLSFARHLSIWLPQLQHVPANSLLHCTRLLSVFTIGLTDRVCLIRDAIQRCAEGHSSRELRSRPKLLSDVS